MNAQRESIVLHGEIRSRYINERDRSCVRENFTETRGIHNAFLYREKGTVK